MGAVRALAANEGAELIRRCRAGDGAAWEEVVQCYSRRIYNLAYRFTSRADAAEDLTQEVFVRVYRSLDQYDPKQGDLQNWLMRLAHLTPVELSPEPPENGNSQSAQRTELKIFTRG